MLGSVTCAPHRNPDPETLALWSNKEVSAVEMLDGCYPPSHVRGVMRDPELLAKLLGSLPGVDPAAACVQATVRALAGHSVPAVLLASVEPN